MTSLKDIILGTVLVAGLAGCGESKEERTPTPIAPNPTPKTFWERKTYTGWVSELGGDITVNTDYRDVRPIRSISLIGKGIYVFNDITGDGSIDYIEVMDNPNPTKNPLDYKYRIIQRGEKEFNEHERLGKILRSMIEQGKLKEDK